MRIDKYITACGAGSRKEVKAYIRDGRVKVNGRAAADAGMHIDEERDEVMLDSVRLSYKKYVYLMLNKPRGVISATFDNHQKTVLDLVPEDYSHYELFPVGRLDIDTTGLLFLTNDGALAHRLTSPRHHAEKVYCADVKGMVDDSDIKKFAEGITLDDGYVCRSAHLEVIKPAAVSKIMLTISEGKFHQVKRMFEAVGKKTLTLKRLSMGGIALDENLPEGEMRELTAAEIELLRKS